MSIHIIFRLKLCDTLCTISSSLISLWSWFKSQIFRLHRNGTNKIRYFDILFFFPRSFSHSVLFCCSNLLQVINCYKIKGERSKEHVVYECEQARCRTRKMFIHFRVSYWQSIFGNNDNWHIKTISYYTKATTGETLARKRICGLRKCRIFLLSAKRVCWTLVLRVTKPSDSYNKPNHYRV